MGTARALIRINAPQSVVWTILADFGGLSQWSPLVSKSASISPINHGLNCERTYDMQMLGTITDKAIEWVEGTSYTVQVRGIPKLPYMTTKLSLREDSGQTVVLVETELHGNDSDLENIGPQIKGIMQITLQGLKEYVETGRKMVP
ncbi:MAG: SRPBCC family protein [Thaumarchaeota archaeon]|nr:SRPBCC family protein [Nitrososphaerota archaeon]